MNVLNPVRRIRKTFVDFAFRHIGRPEREFFDDRRSGTSTVSICRRRSCRAYPHELSGGMRQRVTIALATICRPEFIIADEPTTALDVVVQKGVLAMIREVQQEMGSSILFVTHDMTVHANMADRLGIMYAGRLVEEAPTREIFATPLHPYTAHLIQSLPRIGDLSRKKALPGAPPNLADAAAGLPVPPALPARHGHLPARERRRSPRSRPATASPASPRAPRFEPDGRGRATGVGARPDAGGAAMSGDLLAVDRVIKSYAFGGLFGTGRLQCGRRRQLHSRGGTAGDLHHRRRVRLGQDDARAHDPQPDPADVRRHPLPRHGPCHDPRRTGAHGLHAPRAADLPEPVRGVQSR